MYPSPNPKGFADGFKDFNAVVGVLAKRHQQLLTEWLDKIISIFAD